MRGAIALAALLCVAACGSSADEPAGPIAGAAEIAGPYHTEPYGALDPTIVGALEARCRELTDPAAPPIVGTNHTLGLADARGSGHLLLMFKGPDGDVSTCFGSVESGGTVTVEGGAGGAPGGNARGGGPIPSVGPLEILPGFSMSDSASWSATSGRAGSEVGAVVIELRDGTRVVASLANGMYAASWPTGEAEPRTLVYDGGGSLAPNQSP